ncbi:MAG TPA: redoxin domain-containing protein [Ginsengibacter sp.]
MKKLCTIIASCLVLVTNAQQSKNVIKPLSIGDQIPDITIPNVYNYPAYTIHLSDLKGKLVILDFWATWCTSCIAGFPHADSLQKEFKNDIRIFLVNSKATGDNASKIISFFKKRETRTGLINSLPLIIGDTVLDKYFPHTYIPHYVWIDQAGYLMATTSSLELNSHNIKAALTGKGFSVHLKNDQKTYFNIEKPVFWNGNGKAGDNLIYRSILTGYTEGLYGAGKRINNQGLTIGLNFFNLSLLDLFKSAFEDEKVPYFINNRIIMEVKDPTAFGQSFYDDTLKYSHTYCYDITVPPSTDEEVYRYFREDLERIFKVTAVIEKRKLPSIVLKASPQIQKALAKKNTPRLVDVEKETLHKFIHNTPIVFAIQLLNSYSPLPIIDESNLNANISIELPYDLSDTKALMQSLTNAGFNVKEEQRLIDVTVLKDVPSQTKKN